MKSPLRLLAAFVAVLTLFAAGMLWWQAERTRVQLRQQILSQSEKRSLQLADAMSGQVSGLIGSFDLVLLQLRRVWVEDRKAFDETAKAILGSFPEGAATHLSVAGRDGDVTYYSLGSEGQFYIGDRPHFQRMKAGGDRLVIGNPVRSRITGDWSFAVGRPLLRGGRFDGTIQFLVSSDYLSKKLAGLELSPRDVVVLVQRSDGAFLARSRDNDKAMGTGVPKAPFLVPDAPRSGIFQGEGFLDGTLRTYGWQQVGDYGLVVAIGLDDQSVLAPLSPGLSLNRGLNAALIALIVLSGGIVAVLMLRLAAKQEEQAASEARFRSLTNLSSDWYWEQDEHFRFRDIGDAGPRIDLHASNPVGKARWELDNTNLTPEQWAAHRALLERHEPFRDFEFMRMAADGQLRWVRVSGEPIFNERGEFAGYRGVGKDITVAKQMEAALRSSEARFRSVFEQAAVGMTLRRLDGSWVAVNDVFAKMLGYSLEELAAGAQFNHPDDEPAAESRRVAMARGEVETYQHEKRYVTKDGRIIWVAIWVSVVRDEALKPVMRLAVIQDVTARKRAEEEIRRLNAELEQRVAARTAELAEANRELETFAYSVSHDLKAPLRGIDGYSQLLLENYAGRLDEEGRRFLQNVRRGAHNMNELIDDLLVYSRIERGGRSAEALKLRPLVEALIGELKADPAAGHCRVDCELPELLVLADREGLTMAVRNLLDNAVKFCARVKDPRVEVGGRDNGSSCILWVRDNGIGFDMKYHDRIFGIFERLHRAEDYPGTGVGLAIVRKAMSRMGGRVWAESVPGQGATFYIEIPKRAEIA